MAATTTRTVDVTLVDSANYEVTLKINDPIDEITLTQIKSGFAPLIATGIVYSRYGNLYTNVARAVLTETTKETLA